MSVRAFCRSFLLDVLFECIYKHIAECLGRNFRPDLSGVLCRECITPTVILIFADFTVFQLLSLVSPCRKHFEHRFVHSALAAIKDDMYLVPLLLCSHTMNVLDSEKRMDKAQIAVNVGDVQSLERVQQQQVCIQAVEQIEARGAFASS